MDWKTFVSNLVESLAWPIGLIFIVWMLRGYLCRLLPFIERLKYKDFEVEFSRSVRELAEKSQTIAEPVPPQEEGALGKLEVQRLYELAEVSPRVAIIEAWLQVENAAAEVIQRRGLTSFRRTPIGPLAITNHLRKSEVLSTDEIEIFNRL